MRAEIEELTRMPIGDSKEGTPSGYYVLFGDFPDKEEPKPLAPFG